MLKTLSRSFKGTLFVLMMIQTSSWAQIDTIFKDSLCSYTWNSALNDCPDTLICISPGAWNSTPPKVIDVPKNITRISNKGLKLCLRDVNLTLPVDIIYAIDLSGSMIQNIGSFPEGAGVRPGDSLKQRDDALDAGFRYQIDNLPSSRAGYLGFGSYVAIPSLFPASNLNNSNPYLRLAYIRDAQVQRPLQVGIQANQTRMQQIVSNLSFIVENNYHALHTNYKETLDSIITWIRDPLVSPNKSKAVIFISDGAPNPSSNSPTQNQIDSLVKYKCPVYGIFLGSSMGTALVNLATQTNGLSYLVPPNKADTLKNVVKNIVQTLKKVYAFKTLKVENLSVPASSNAISCSKSLGDDSTWVAVLDKHIPLVPNNNDIHVAATFGDPAGANQDTTLDVMFKINVGGQSFTNKCYFCWYKTKIDVLYNNVKVDSLTWAMNNYTIRVTYNGPDTLKQITVRAITQKADTEFYLLDNPSFTGKSQIFTKTVPFSVLSPSAAVTKGNGTTEANYQDLVSLFYRHPTDNLDTASASVKVVGYPNRIRIYDTIGNPTTLRPYKTAPLKDTVTAGKWVPLYAKAFANTEWLDKYESDPILKKKFKWNAVSSKTLQPIDNSFGIFLDTVGTPTMFYPKKAYDSVDITAKLTLPDGISTIMETIRLYIKPGAPKYLFIEATNDSTMSNLNVPQPYDPILMNKSTKQLSAYAILRDTCGNWVRSAPNPLWNSLDTSVVSVASGVGKGEGIITKGGAPEGTTKIIANQDGMIDTSTVVTTMYDIIRLRIVRLTGGQYFDIDQLTISTNEDSTLYVLGQRSDDTTKWILVNAQWGIDNPAAVELSPPVADNVWKIMPRLPGSGILYASMSASVSDTVRYTFLTGWPIKVSFTIVTPDSLLIAGKPIKGEVRIYNQDGLVPGVWKYPDPAQKNDYAHYKDVLDWGGLMFWPYMKTYLGSVQEGFDTIVYPGQNSIVQSFIGGIDTASFTLYYAHWQQYKHQLTVTLPGKVILSAKTDPFILKPGPLDTIVINPANPQNLTYTSPPFIVKAMGYDTFGNYLKYEPYRWSNDSTLVDYHLSSTIDQIVFDPAVATRDQEGYVTVRGVTYPSIFNHVYIRISGPKSRVAHAYTRDENGNGLLDAIDLEFSKSVLLPLGVPSDFRVKNKVPVFDFITDSIRHVAGDQTNTKYRLYLNEINSILAHRPQTAWTPYLTILHNDSLLENSSDIPTQDGAAPVVWDVVKKVNDVYDRKKDVVTIQLSENFNAPNGGPFLQMNPLPINVFKVWMIGVSDTINVPGMFDKIPLFTNQENALATITMMNGKDINSNHWVNVNDFIKPLADSKLNYPNKYNQKVRVRVDGDIGEIKVAPVPIIPTIKFPIINGKLDPITVPEGIKKIKEGGGAIITIDLQLKKDKNGKITVDNRITGVLLVYDVPGNLVIRLENKENLVEEWLNKNVGGLDSSTTVTICLYWNGLNSKGMACAPGVYKMIFYADFYAKESNLVEKLIRHRTYDATIAVGR